MLIERWYNFSPELFYRCMVIHAVLAKGLLFKFALFGNKALISFFVNHSKWSSFLLLILIYDGENLHCIRSFTIQFRLVPEVNFCFFCQKNQKFQGNFASSVETTLCWEGDKKQCVSGVGGIKNMVRHFFC